MHSFEVLLKKRNGSSLSEQEITEFVQGYVSGNLPDYQMAAFLMTVYYQGMDRNELKAFTKVLMESGEILDLSMIPGIKVDKHSTGGVGDKTTLVLVPLVASCGVSVVKLSGKGLGHTGGTLDKLRSFPGFTYDLKPEEMVSIVNEVGGVMAGHSKNIAPADQAIYDLRNLTATTDSIPLIAASVMSKKLACGSDAFVLDVKCGQGAFMKDIQQAKILAQTMVEIAQSYRKKAVALITDMHQPLGYAIGNNLEVVEAINCLKGEGPADLYELVMTLGAEMLLLSGKASTVRQAYQLLQQSINSGLGLSKLKQIVQAQGGDISGIDDPSYFAKAKQIQPLYADKCGYIRSIDAYELGWAAHYLGAGRSEKNAGIDLSSGLVLTVKRGDYVRVGDVICRIHAPDEQSARSVKSRVEKAITIGEERIKIPPLVIDRISSS
jgi:pyrimidine-nucleoside phosphorylase